MDIRAMPVAIIKRVYISARKLILSDERDRK